MGTAALALAMVSMAACGYPRSRPVLTDPRAADVRSVIVRVVDASRHGLATPHQGAIATLARVASGRQFAAVSAVDAFSSAAEAALRTRGIRVEFGDGGTAVLRIEIHEFEVYPDDAAQAVACAFVSATYALAAADGVRLWKVEQHRMPFPFAGPDLTDSELARIADQAVDAGLASLPTSRRHP